MAVKKDIIQDNRRLLRCAMVVPMALLVVSLITSCLSYSDAKRDIAEDLNDAMIALTSENKELWTRQDTIAALRQMHETTHRPIIYQASDLDFRNNVLKRDAYFTLVLVDNHNVTQKIRGDKIASDSILLVPERNVDGYAVRVQGFADCSVASVFVASDQTLPGVLFALSLFSMAGMSVWRRKGIDILPSRDEMEGAIALSIDGIKLTPLQRQFAQMLIEAPGQRVDKVTLCSVLWGNKDNAEESLYTLVRRTKKALADSKFDIICNRGESYELRVNN